MERLLPVGELMVPNDVELEEDWLCWGWSVDVQQWITRRPGPRILSDFVRLADGDGPQIRAYARRWGILGICKHGLPSSHAGNEGGMPRCQPLDRREDPAWRFDGWEPLERWRYFARQAGAMLNLAASLYADRPGQPEDWQVVVHHPTQPVPWWHRSVKAEWILLSGVVREWIQIGDVRPVMARRPTQGHHVEFGSSAAGQRLFGTLACQLLFTITRMTNVAVCFECAAIYTPTRQPRPISGDIASRAATEECPNAMRSGSAAPTTGGAAVDRPDVVLARWVEDRAMSRSMGEGANRRREGGIGYRKCGDETAKLCEKWNELVKLGPLRQRG